MIKTTAIKKFGIRVLIITVVYLLVKLTMNHEDDLTDGFFNSTAIFYYCSAFVLFMLTWETNDWLIRKQQKPLVNGGLDMKGSLRIMGINLAIVLPVAGLIYYLGIFVFEDFCNLHSDNPWLEFRIDFLRAAILAFTVIVFNLFYHSLKLKKDVENKLNVMEKEVITSKYGSLKNQISPHFLFNSLNTLTSLMYEDRDLASDFVSRLASCYRYILDNREEDLVSLEKELNFLDSFIFMMDIRHKHAVVISTNIMVNPTDFVVPTLSVQMLVENALKHNYFSKEKPLRIQIEAKDHTIMIKNNLHERKLEEETTQLGLKNIRKRYSFYTDKKLSVVSSEGVFKVGMPLLSKNIKPLSMLAVS